MYRDAIIIVLSFLALVLKLAFGIEIEQVIQAELADTLSNLFLVAASIYGVVKARQRYSTSKEKSAD